MNYLENFNTFIVNEQINVLIEQELIDENLYINTFEDSNLKDINIEQELNEEAIAAGIAVFFVALFAGGLLQGHLRIRKAIIDLDKKIAEESDPEKKNKLKEDFAKLTKGEKALKGEIAATEEKLKKSKGKLDAKQTERAKRKVLKYQAELQHLKDIQKKVDKVKAN